MSQRPTCPKCGSPVAPNARQCARCGTALGTLDEAPTEAATAGVDVPRGAVAPLPPVRKPDTRQGVVANEMTEIEDTLVSGKKVNPELTAASAPSITDQATSLIKGRFDAAPAPKPIIEPTTTPSVPSVRPMTGEITLQGEKLPWLNPWVIAVGSMLLIALGLLIGLLLS